LSASAELLIDVDLGKKEDNIIGGHWVTEWNNNF